MKKKLLMPIALLAIVATMVVTLVACKPPVIQGLPSIGLPEDYNGMKVAEEYKARELFIEAYNNYLNADNYARMTYYSNESDDMTLYMKTDRKVNGDKLFLQEVVLIDTIMSMNEGKRVYIDSEGAHAIYTKDKEIVKGEGEGDEMFAVENWPDYSDYDSVEYYKEVVKKSAEEFKSNIKEDMVAYDVSKAELMAEAHDDTVYTKDDVYYFTLTVDCMSQGAADAQKKAIDAIIAINNASNVKFIGDTTIQVAVENIDGKMMITLISVTEHVNGKLNLYKPDCKLVASSKINWTAGASDITSDELGNLAK